MKENNKQTQDRAKSLIHDEPSKISYINFKLAALGQPIFGEATDASFLDIANPLLRNHQEKNRLLQNYFCPADRRIQDFINDYLKDLVPPNSIKLPINTFILDRPGLARTLSLPPNKDKFISDIVSSYRVEQGVLHNPKHDRRTTKGSFHIAEGGFPIPDDKRAVPKNVFSKLLAAAVTPPDELLFLPFTSNQKENAKLFVSLMMRPTVCPEVPGVTSKKSNEIRFFAPGNLVSNLDFVENIFGNAGDPYLPENDAGLDTEHWTGHSGCVILAPHLITLTKKSLGLPPFSEATEKQKRDGMCWKSPKDLYNDGVAFKVTARDQRGVMVTLIADNYFGYSKKEIKTQISYSANLFGNCEEEHSGGALAFPSYDLGDSFSLEENLPQNKMTFKDITKAFGSMMDLKSDGYGIDKTYPKIFYVPEDSKFNLRELSIKWTLKGKEKQIPLRAFHTYVLPSGYKIQLKKQMGGPNWRLIGTAGEGTFCHKPCTVSGGGKSEISKSIANAMIQGPVFTSNFKDDMNIVTEIMNRDFGSRFKKKSKHKRQSRPILSPKRSLGSVIKLFTPSEEFTDEHNSWIENLAPHIREMVFVIKRHYKPEWGNDWKEHFGVDLINGHQGHELKYGDHKLVANYLRIGFYKDGSRRIYKLRQDYNPAAKVQTEDDITASVVVPRDQLEHLNPDVNNKSLKMAVNCESKLFQRPDDCIFRGYDKEAEKDLASPYTFLSNFEPVTRQDAQDLINDAIGFGEFTFPIQDLIRGFVSSEKPDYVVSSAHPRLVNGKPTKNPRYLQNRPDLMDPQAVYLSKVGTRFYRMVPANKPVHSPVNAVLAGRRNNPADPKNGIPPLAVYNPIHYQELPELFMDFVTSVTGKSPSTTGFGSEGALTKGPFNALWPIVDLNNTLVSYILTGYGGFTSAAGFIGPNVQVDHDISLLIPEIWCRMGVEERDPAFLIKNGYLEKCDDFEHNGKKVFGSRLGYRITRKFVHSFLGRIFNNPNVVFNEEMLKPEIQDQDMFANGIENITATMERVAKQYFQDGSVEAACPPLKALLHIMADGHYKGKKIKDKEIRDLFKRENLLSSDWYKERLATKQTRDSDLWTRHVQTLDAFISKDGNISAVEDLSLEERLREAKAALKSIQSSAYLKKLKGTIGADPLHKQVPKFVKKNRAKATSAS